MVSNVAVLAPEPTFGGYVACPSSSQCTAVGAAGEEATFNPTSSGTPNVAKLAETSWTGLSCPSVGQCTAVSIGGIEETFNPAAPAGGTAVTINTEDGLHAVSCPSTTQCTTVGEAATWLTFDPMAFSTPLSASFGPRETQPSALSCPSLTQCTEAASFVNTFNPTQPGAPVSVTASGIEPDLLACPTVSQCTGVGQEGAVTFNPTVPGTVKAVKNYTGDLTGIACPSATQCTAISAAEAVTFDPRSTSSASKTTIAPGEALASVSCPSASQCTAVDLAGHELTFRPSAAAAPSTSARKLAEAVKACNRIRKRSKRASCIRAAEHR